jgi:hypothetical protein
MRELSTRRNLLVQGLSFIYSFSYRYGFFPARFGLFPAMILKTLVLEITCLWPRLSKIREKATTGALATRCRILLPKLPAKYGLFQPGSGLFSDYFQPGSGFLQPLANRPVSR